MDRLAGNQQLHGLVVVDVFYQQARSRAQPVAVQIFEKARFFLIHFVNFQPLPRAHFAQAPRAVAPARSGYTAEERVAVRAGTLAPEILEQQPFHLG